mmetsp:Transcript_53554/g.120742  ORF Transcript_53554/g.120742 Transcript_53554/m.120742 type:complete len:220 (-) Transcript_53554:12-671(-)
MTSQRSTAPSSSVSISCRRSSANVRSSLASSPVAMEAAGVIAGRQQAAGFALPVIRDRCSRWPESSAWVRRPSPLVSQLLNWSMTVFSLSGSFLNILCRWYRMSWSLRSSYSPSTKFTNSVWSIFPLWPMSRALKYMSELDSISLRSSASSFPHFFSAQWSQMLLSSLASIRPSSPANSANSSSRSLSNGRTFVRQDLVGTGGESSAQQQLCPIAAPAL